MFEIFKVIMSNNVSNDVWGNNTKIAYYSINIIVIVRPESFAFCDFILYIVVSFYVLKFQRKKMIKYVETEEIKQMISKNKKLKQNDVYAIIRIIESAEPDAVEKVISDQYYRVKRDSIKKFCERNDLIFK